MDMRKCYFPQKIKSWFDSTTSIWDKFNLAGDEIFNKCLKWFLKLSSYLQKNFYVKGTNYDSAKFKISFKNLMTHLRPFSDGNPLQQCLKTTEWVYKMTH